MEEGRRSISIGSCGAGHPSGDGKRESRWTAGMLVLGKEQGQRGRRPGTAREDVGANGARPAIAGGRFGSCGSETRRDTYGGDKEEREKENGKIIKEK